MLFLLCSKHFATCSKLDLAVLEARCDLLEALLSNSQQTDITNNKLNTIIIFQYTNANTN